MSQQDDLVDLKDYIYGTEVIEEELLFSPYLKEGDSENTQKDNVYLALRKKIQDDVNQILNSSNDDHKAVSNYFKKLINSDPDKKQRLNFCYFCVFAREFWRVVGKKFKNAVINFNYGTDINFLHDILVAIHNSGIKSYGFVEMKNAYADLDNGAYIFKTPLREVIKSMPNNFDLFYLKALQYIKPVSLDKSDIDLLISKADESVKQRNDFWIYISNIKNGCQKRPIDGYYPNIKVKDVLDGQEPVENKISSDNVNILFSKPLKNIDVSGFNSIVLNFGLDKTNTSDNALNNITKNFKYDQPENIYSTGEPEYDIVTEKYICPETKESQEIADKKKEFEEVIDRLGEEKILGCGNIPAQFINDCKYRKAIDECHNIGAKELINEFRNKELASDHPNDSKSNEIVCEVIKQLDKRSKFDKEIANRTCELVLKKIKDPKDLDSQENKDMINDLYETHELKKEIGDIDLPPDASAEQIKQKKLELEQKVNEIDQKKQTLLAKVNDLKETSDKNCLFNLRDQAKKLYLEIESIAVNKLEDLADKENRFNLLKEIFDFYQQVNLIEAYDLNNKIRDANSFSDKVLEGWKNELKVFNEKNDLKSQIDNFMSSQEMEDCRQFDIDAHGSIWESLSLLIGKILEFKGSLEDLKDIRDEFIKIKNDVAEVNKLGNAKEQLKQKIDDFKKTEEVKEYAKYLQTGKNIYDELDNLKKEIDKTKQLSELNDIEQKFNKTQESVSNAKGLIELAKKKTEKPPEEQIPEEKPKTEKTITEEQKPEDKKPKEEPKPEEEPPKVEKPKVEKPPEEQIPEEKPKTEKTITEEQKPEDKKPKEEPKPEEEPPKAEKPKVEKPPEEQIPEEKPKSTRPKEKPKTEEKPSETQNNNSPGGNIFKSPVFLVSSVITASGIPIGITTSLIFGIATSGVGAVLLIVVITKTVLFKKQMKPIKENNKNTKAPKEKVGPIGKIKNKNKKEETKDSDTNPEPDKN